MDTALLIVRVNQVHENPNTTSFNQLQDEINKGKKEATLEILPFILNLENLKQSKKHAMQNLKKFCKVTS